VAIVDLDSFGQPLWPRLIRFEMVCIHLMERGRRRRADDLFILATDRRDTLIPEDAPVLQGLQVGGLTNLLSGFQQQPQQPSKKKSTKSKRGSTDPLGILSDLTSEMPSLSGGAQGVSQPKTPEQTMMEEQNKQQLKQIKAEGKARAQEIKAENKSAL
jgi:hypothetical protein